MNFHLFERHHSKSRIFERMENILNDGCHPWTEKPCNNSCSRKLTIVNAVVTLIASGVRSIDRSLFFYGGPQLSRQYQFGHGKINLATAISTPYAIKKINKKIK